MTRGLSSQLQSPCLLFPRREQRILWLCVARSTRAYQWLPGDIRSELICMHTCIRTHVYNYILLHSCSTRRRSRGSGGARPGVVTVRSVSESDFRGALRHVRPPSAHTLNARCLHQRAAAGQAGGCGSWVTAWVCELMYVVCYVRCIRELRAFVAFSSYVRVAHASCRKKGRH